jgi:WD40 repeat protein
MSTNEPLTSYAQQQHWVMGISFFNQGEAIISASGDKTLHIWNPKTGETLQVIQAEEGLYSLDISPDEKFLIAGSESGNVYGWDMLSWQQVLNIRAQGSSIYDIEFNQDGSRFITAGFEGSAKVFKFPSGDEVATLYGHTANVIDVTIAPDGETAYTTCNDGYLRGFMLDTDSLIELAISRLTRDLTEEECQIFLHLEKCPVD